MASASAVRSPPVPTTNKRKRGPTDQDGGRNVKNSNTNGDGGLGDASSFTPVHQMLQAIDQNGLPGGDDSTRTAQAALATPMVGSQYPEPGPFDGTPSMVGAFDDGSPSGGQGVPGSTQQALYEARANSSKPSVGTPQWHQQRKDNHKEVERRRREVINEGIENISKIVPNCEKNKGAVLQRTCQYVGELQQKERSWQNDRATCEIAIKELTNRVDRMRQSAETAWTECSKWQQRCRDAGLQFDDYDDGALPGLGEEDDGGEGA